MKEHKCKRCQTEMKINYIGERPSSFECPNCGLIDPIFTLTDKGQKILEILLRDKKTDSSLP